MVRLNGLKCICFVILFIDYWFNLSTGSVWFASEMKALSDDCEQFMAFPPGHIYSSKQGLQSHIKSDLFYSNFMMFLGLLELHFL